VKRRPAAIVGVAPGFRLLNCQLDLTLAGGDELATLVVLASRVAGILARVDGSTVSAMLKRSAVASRMPAGQFGTISPRRVGLHDL